MENEKKNLVDAVLDLLQDHGVDRTDLTKKMVEQLADEAEFAQSIEPCPFTGKYSMGKYKGLPCLIHFCKDDDIIFMMPKGWGSPRFMKKSDVDLG